MTVRILAFALLFLLPLPVLAQDADTGVRFHHIVKGRIDHDNYERVCPEHWVVNRMPGIVMQRDKTAEPPREYLIIRGKRVETGDVDMGWIKANCPIKPESVW